MPHLNNIDQKRYEDDDTFKLNVILHTEDHIKLSVQPPPLEDQDQDHRDSVSGETINWPEITKSQRKYLMQLYYRWEYGRPMATFYDRKMSSRTKNYSRSTGESALGPSVPRDELPTLDKNTGKHLTLTGGEFVNKKDLIEKDREESKLSSRDSGYYSTDSHQLITIMGHENLAITGSILNKKGRSILWCDGCTNVPERELGVDHLLNFLSHKASIIESLCSLNTKLTSQYKTLKLVAGSPTIILPGRLH